MYEFYDETVQVAVEYGKSFPTNAIQAECIQHCTSGAARQDHSPEVPGNVVYDNQFMTKKRYYEGSSAV
jgi:hypothetical protein